ncbi:histidine phosphatase family protein [Terribacillus halophilus]|uniref:histidine phosphatase family protein n=1 Tax=Terribacillus halophilus TaxID=361279 RepID=UPI000B8058AE|nr:histidine phosphatase family protein [Terribacillus halophilus]
MTTVIYMVRHGESPKEGNERTRGLTEIGKLDAYRITESLKGEEIEVFVSSPYKRAVETIRDLAEHVGKKVIEMEDLRERVFVSGEKRISDEELIPLLEKSFADPSFALTRAESNAACQNRAIAVLKDILSIHKGKKIAIATHGAIMTLMMGYYDSRYDLGFLLHITKPDIYKMEFNGHELLSIKKVWQKIKPINHY